MMEIRRGSPYNNRRKLKELIEGLIVLTPRSVLARWRILDAILILLINKLKKGQKYKLDYIEQYEISSIVKKPSSIHNNVRVLIKIGVLSKMDPFEEKHPKVQINHPNGFSILAREFDTWEQIFSLTHEYDLLRPLLKILRERFDELDRLVHGPEPKQADL
jgi:hypothetical protein